MKFLEKIKDVTAIVERIELYVFNVEVEQNFSFGTWNNRQQIFISIQSGVACGYGEEVLTVNDPDVSLEDWGNELAKLKGKTIPEAFAIVRENINIWQDSLSEIAEMALIDLVGRVMKVSALELLDLSGRDSIEGVYVILSHDIDDVEDKAKWAVEHKHDTFIKVKLFGDNDLDCAVISAVRKYAKEKTYLIGDVNGGYLPKTSTEPVSNEEIARQLLRLHQAGLNACEDPAYFDNQRWVDLQKRVDTLALIPDYPMRPAGIVKENFVEGMGTIYNIHPGCTASILDAIELADCIKQSGAKLMIGDTSLIGVGCSIWQQLAIGLGADWVEATEKRLDSQVYYKVLVKKPTIIENSTITLEFPIYGFGVILDKEALKEHAYKTYFIE